jgi:hypothetical protein
MAEKFSFTELKRLIKDGQLKELQDAKNYILRFFLSIDQRHGYVC